MIQDGKPALMSMDEMARDICAYLGDDTASKLYVKVVRTAKHVLHQLDMFVSPAVKSVPVAVGENMTAMLPGDVEFVSKVGVCCANGRLKVLGRDDSLCTPPNEKFFKCCDCSNEQSGTTTQGAACCEACTFHNIHGSENFPIPSSWDWIGGSRYFYGYTPKMFAEMGYYKHDIPNGRLIFSGGCDVCPGSIVVVEYASSLSIEQYQMIPRKWYFTVQHRVAHQIKMNNSPGAAQEEDRLFKREYDMLKRTYQSNYTLEDFVSALRGGYKSSPKR